MLVPVCSLTVYGVQVQLRQSIAACIDMELEYSLVGR